MGIFIHSVIGATGVTVALMKAPQLIFLLRVIGIMAVFVICFRFWYTPVGNAEASIKNVKVGFWEGVTVHLFNPIALVFAFTFIPNFINEGSSFFWQFISLSTISNLLSFLINGLTIVLVFRVKKLFEKYVRHFRTVASLLLMSLAFKLCIDLF